MPPTEQAAAPLVAKSPSPARSASEVVTPKSTPKPKPKPKKVFTREGAPHCGRLPSDAVLKTWRVHIFNAGGSYAGPPPPGGYPKGSSRRRIHSLGDRTFITETEALGCHRTKGKRKFNKCLPPDTLIATPHGDVPVQSLSPGAAVWTRSARGKRVRATVLETRRRTVGADHKLVWIQLADGRRLQASVGHPLADGSGIETVAPGSAVDGVQVTSVQLLPFDQPATYDLLPSGDTGIYWANGVPLKSTIPAAASPDRAISDGVPAP